MPGTITPRSGRIEEEEKSESVKRSDTTTSAPFQSVLLALSPRCGLALTALLLMKTEDNNRLFSGWKRKSLHILTVPGSPGRSQDVLSPILLIPTH